MEEAEHYAYPEHWSQALQWIYSKQGNVRGGSYDSYVTTHIRFVPVLLSYCQGYTQVDEYQHSVT